MSEHALYRPKGKAGEYASFACNFYVGCSNGCEYCYLKKGIGKKTLGGDKPTLKKCFRNEEHAVRVFMDELFKGPNGIDKNPSIFREGILFTFTSDPCLKETWLLNGVVIKNILRLGIPCQLLTKRTEWIFTELGSDLLSTEAAKLYLSVGFTLTGRDDLEPKAAPNDERIEALKLLHKRGIKTFASIEPVIDIDKSLEIVKKTADFVDLFKVGLLSGGKYKTADLRQFVADLAAIPGKPKIYLKESIVKRLGKARSEYGENFVEADFRL
jgi:DNA repair photolyase